VQVETWAEEAKLKDSRSSELESFQITGRELRKPGEVDGEAAVVGDVQVQHVQLAARHRIDKRVDCGDGPEPSPSVHHKRAVAIGGPEVEKKQDSFILFF
jgi:hypothetical protein